MQAGTQGADGQVILPPPLELSSEHLHQEGIFLLDSSEDMYLWVGKFVPSATLQAVFGVASLEEVDISKVGDVFYVVVTVSKLNCELRFPLLFICCFLYLFHLLLPLFISFATTLPIHTLLVTVAVSLISRLNNRDCRLSYLT